MGKKQISSRFREPADGASRRRDVLYKSPRSGRSERGKTSNRTDGTRPLRREVMLVTLRGRLGRQEEWYRKIVAFNDPVSLLEKRRDLIFYPVKG